MAMTLPGEGDGEAVSAINTTPLVDVMLVLLIIFLITIPVVNFSVPVQLPRIRNELRESTPRDVVVSVDAQGRIYWFDSRLPDAAALAPRLQALARQDPQPELHVRGDAAGEFEPVGRVLLAAQRAGLRHVGFITEPPPKG
jgi:biopolymer transport protein ExbD